MSDAAYIAIDLETTGLDPIDDQIMEIAWAPLDERFQLLAPIKSLPLEVTPAVRERLTSNQYTRDMHAANGLTREALDGGIPLAMVEKIVMNAADKWHWGQPKLTIFGSSVHFDLRFIQVHMPNLAQWLHYRVLDVTTLISFAEATGAWQNNRAAIAHRAAADIDWSIGTTRDILNALARPASVVA